MFNHQWTDQDKCEKCGDRDWYAEDKCRIPDEIICLDCLKTQKAINVIENNNQCICCGLEIDLNNLNDVEV